jgi:hypothetical protein
MYCHRNSICSILFRSNYLALLLVLLTISACTKIEYTERTAVEAAKQAITSAVVEYAQRKGSGCSADIVKGDIEIIVQSNEMRGAGDDKYFSVKTMVVSKGVFLGEVYVTVYGTYRIFGFPLNGSDIDGWGFSCKSLF